MSYVRTGDCVAAEESWLTMVLLFSIAASGVCVCVWMMNEEEIRIGGLSWLRWGCLYLRVVTCCSAMDSKIM